MKYTISAILVVAMMLIPVFSVALDKENPNAISYEKYSKFQYKEVIEETTRGYDLVEGGESFYFDLENDFAAEVYDVQGIPLTDETLNRYWYPQYLATAVIVVDKSRVNSEIKGWEDLKAAEEGVGYLLENEYERLIIPAISYGLTGEYYSEESFALLKELRDAERLLELNSEAPILLCMDYQGVELAKSNENLEIIIPEEGTLTYEKGLVAKGPMAFYEGINQVIMENDLRTLDGTSGTELYPSSTEYEKAEYVTDIEGFLDVTRKNSSEVERKILTPQMISPFDQAEHNMVALVFIALVIFWLGSVLRRVFDPEVRRILVTAALLIIGWVFTRYTYYQYGPESGLDRISWYSFYIFEIGLPLTIFWIALSMENLHTKNHKINVTRIIQAMMGLYLLLVALIATNDLHMLIFEFETGAGNWVETVTYGPLYNITFLFKSITLGVAIVILLKKAWSSSKKSNMIQSGVLVVLFIVFALGLATGDKFFINSDYVIFYSLFVILFLEIAMNSGLIPVNTKYNLIFRESQLKMQILDKSGKVWLSSGGKKLNINSKTWNEIKDFKNLPLRMGENKLLYAQPVSGGVVAWQDDISEINRLHKEINENMKKITAANAILARENKVKPKAIISKEKQALRERLEVEISRQVEDLTLQIEKFSKNENKKTATGKIILLLCHIKRRCSLFFTVQEEKEIPLETLVVYLDELAELVQYANGQFFNVCNAKGKIPAGQATLIYDFYYEVIEACIEIENIRSVVLLEEEESLISLKILPSLQIGEEILNEDLKETIINNGGKIEFKQMEETTGITISFRKEAR